MLNQRKSQRGFTAIIVAFLVLLAIFGVATSLVILTIGQTKISLSLVKSSQSYYTAEAGVEDILLRLSKSMQWTAPYSFSLENSTVELTVSDILGGARTITAKGNSENRFRKVEVVYEISGSATGFFYGAQVGDGGLVMEESSKVLGNVFSNGDATLQGQQSEITDTIRVAGNGHKISGKGKISQDAYADICQEVEVVGTLHANTVSDCDYGSLTGSGLPVNPVSLPITDSQIQEWKDYAVTGGIIGSYTKDRDINYLGPVKIEGDLTIKNTAQLVITGTIWVTGTISIRNSAQVRLDSSYGSMSGVIVGDGLVELKNSSISSGSGTPGSYLMYISTSSLNPALTIGGNHPKADILYSNTGWVQINNNSDMRSVDAYGIQVNNSALLTYDIGLADAFFTSGPSAGWTVTSWKEVQ